LGLKNWWDKKQEEKRIEEEIEREEEENQIRLQEEEKERQRQEHQELLDILDHFEMNDLKNFCKNFLGSEPPRKKYDYDTSRWIELMIDRKAYIDFVRGYFFKKQLKLKQLKDYVLKHRMLPPSYFGMESEEAGDQREFENIMNTIRAEFEPENITNEEHLEAQLTIFLKAKFPEKKVERQIVTKKSDILDILIDGKYVLELKVPKQKNDLRNLSAQLDEYKDDYSYLCAVIADISRTDYEVMVLDPRLAQNIKDYVDKYKMKLNIPSIVFNVKKKRIN